MGAVLRAIGAPRGAGMHGQVATRIEILAEAWAGALRQEEVQTFSRLTLVNKY